MIPSKNCLDLIKSFEGCRLKAYNDPASGGLPITIGWGNTYRADGTNFKLGDTITQPIADNLLQLVANQKGKEVAALLGSTVVNQNQFDALVDFGYNCGLGNLSSSTLLKKVKLNPKDPTIGLEFLKWDKAAGKVLAGLTKRCTARVKLYFTKDISITK